MKKEEPPVKYPFVEVRGVIGVREFPTVAEAEAYALKLCNGGNSAVGVRVSQRQAIAYSRTTDSRIVRLETETNEAYTNMFHSNWPYAESLPWHNAQVFKGNAMQRFTINHILNDKMTAYGSPIDATNDPSEAKSLAKDYSGNRYGVVIIDHEAGTVDWGVQVTKIGEPCTWEVPK